METNGYSLLLPEGTLDYFNISDVKESKMCIRDRHSMDINRPEGWIYVICVPIFNFIAQHQCNSFSFLEPFPPEALHPFLYLRFLRIVCLLYTSRCV